MSVSGRRAQRGHRSAPGLSRGGGPADPRWDRLSRLPGLGHLPRTATRAPMPSFREGQGGHLSARRARRCSRSGDAGPGAPTVRLAWGVFSRPQLFLPSVQFSGVFILKRTPDSSLVCFSSLPSRHPQWRRAYWYLHQTGPVGRLGGCAAPLPLQSTRAFPRLRGGLGPSLVNARRPWHSLDRNS